MSPRWKKAVRVVAIIFAVVLVQQAWRHGHDYVFPEKFLVVEPGHLYRGAWQYDFPMRRIVQGYRIKTVIALAHPPTDPMSVHEKALSESLGARWLHIPIVEGSVTERQRQTVSDALERAADALAEPSNQPVYFHCHHGVNRTSMVQMAYRMLHCGYTLDQAQDEIARTPIGLVPVRHGVDYRYMSTFYRERVLPRRAGESVASAATPQPRVH